MKIFKKFHEHKINKSDVSKTLKSIFAAMCFFFMLPTTIQAQEDDSFMLNISEFTVKFGQDANFNDGVKKWNKCYKDNEGKSTWNVWKRLQGKGSIYVMASRMNSWAEMDESDPASSACSGIAYNAIIPHIESSQFNIARSLPDVSKSEGLGDNTIVWVTNFMVNDRQEFTRIVKEVNSTIVNKEGDNRGYWYRYLGGDTPDYFVSTPFKNFADLDNDRDGVWKIYESVHGEKKTKEMRDAFRASVDKSVGYIYTLSEDLSMN